MASLEVKLNSALCCIINSCKKYPDKIIKSIVKDFYDLDTVSNSKDLLVADITSTCSDLNVKLPAKHRKTTDNKYKFDLDDIINLYHIIDDLGALERLPRYATDNLDELPITRMDSGGLSVVVNKLDNICETLSTLHHSAMLQGPSGRLINESRLPAVSVDSDGGGMLIDDHIRWYDSAQDSVSEEPFASADLLNRRKRRKILNAQGQLNNSSTAPAAPATQVRNQQLYSTIAQKTVAPVKPKRIIGQSNNTDNPNMLKSAKPYVKKAVFGVYNVQVGETVQSATNFVADICGAQPINCFLVNTNNANNANALDVNNVNNDHPIAFRVCIDDKYSVKLLDPMTWHNGIVIKP